MAVYAIGDVQGCHDELSRLLEQIQFDPAQDQLWFCGDLVNRGGQSLEVLRLVHSLREHCVVVLGNHDLSLLSVAGRAEQEQARVNVDLRRILFADDRDTLLTWLRHCPLAHYDESLDFLMVHAGIATSWDKAATLRHAGEVEARLRRNDHSRLLRAIFGNQPDTWQPRLRGVERWRLIINILTRMRYVSPRGRLNFKDKGPPGTQKPGLYTWFAAPGRRPIDTRIVCGHWSALGLFMGLNVFAIDTGCVWGGYLTALRLDTPVPQLQQVPASPSRFKGGDED